MHHLSYKLLIAILLLLSPLCVFASTAKVLVVAGGGSGGSGNGGNGGGGAGSVEYNAAFSVSAGSYTVTIGAGGAGTSNRAGNSGGNSVFGSITAYGGGAGAGSDNTPGAPTAGGSGGGGDLYFNTGAGAGSGSNVFAGGNGINDGNVYPGGGGGGASANGANYSGTTAGNGGAGIADASIGNLLTHASAGVSGVIAGGGGGGVATGGTKGAGGSGGGGAGSQTNGANGTSATANTGSGGGGGSQPSSTSGSGGSGIVIVEYLTADFTHTGGDATGTSGSYTWVKFTSSGTLTLTAAGGGGGGGSGIATTTLQDFRYSYDPIGNITQLLDYSGTNGYASTSYHYDNLYRLTSGSTTLATLTNWLQTFAYDTLGNLTSKSDVGSYTYGGTGFTNPHAATVIGANSYSYDNAGNLLTSGNGTATTTNAWNYRNRLTDTNDGNATTTHYSYDERDQRVQMDTKRGSAATTTTKYFNNLYEVTSDGTNSTTTMYITLPDGIPLAMVEGTGSATTTSVIHTDHLGGTNVVSNETGSARELVNYAPYGSVRQDEKSGTTDLKKKYAGTEYDSATNLSYMQARYQSGTEGRFISQDPLVNNLGSENVTKLADSSGAYFNSAADQNPWRRLSVARNSNQQWTTMLLTDPQMLNTYSYGRNNPLRFLDPSGLAAYGFNVGYTAEAGFGLFGGFTISIGVAYVSDSKTGKSYLAFPITYGNVAGVGNKNISFPEGPKGEGLQTGVAGLNIGLGPSYSGTYSPDANTPDDLKSKSTNVSISAPVGSVQVSVDQNGSKSYTIGGGAKYIGAVSSYPTQTWVPVSIPLSGKSKSN